MVLPVSVKASRKARGRRFANFMLFLRGGLEAGECFLSSCLFVELRVSYFLVLNMLKGALEGMALEDVEHV